MLAELILVAAASINSLNFTQLEDAYWNCDTAYMTGDMTSAIFTPCLTITDKFQDTFLNKEHFTKYHEHYSKSKWAERGYTE